MTFGPGLEKRSSKASRFLRAPSPIEHPIESGAFAVRLEDEINGGGAQRGRNQEEVVQVAQQQFQLQHEHIAGEFPACMGMGRGFVHGRVPQYGTSSAPQRNFISGLTDAKVSDTSSTNFGEDAAFTPSSRIA